MLTPMAATDEKLWGGTITDVSFDPAEWLVRMHVEVHHVDRADEYLLTLTGIKQLIWTGEVPTSLELRRPDRTSYRRQGRRPDGRVRGLERAHRLRWPLRGDDRRTPDLKPPDHAAVRAEPDHAAVRASGHEH
jgi:hypothetical protein